MRVLFSGIAILSVLATAPVPRVAAAEAIPDTQADRDWATYEEVRRAPPPKPYDEMSARETSEWYEKRGLKMRSLGLAFLEKYPADARRWKIVAEFDPNYPRFVKQWGDFDAAGADTNSVIDEAASSAWKAKVAELKSALAKGGDVPADVRDAAATDEALKPFLAAQEAQDKGERVDLAALHAKLTDFAAKHPAAAGGEMLLFYYTTMLEEQEPEKAQPEKAEAMWSAFAASPNSSIVKVARGKLAFLELAKKPLEIAFTAIDGRAVDLKQLRGKVVLVDFWATWCGPCVAELPNVKKVYEKYHGKGFEVVGISLEMAQVGSQDTPDQKAAKLAKARKTLTQFIEKQSLPWPQYFDGKGWDNDISKKYCLSGIPAMFLLDQDGRIVTTNARGARLEKEVVRLLNR